MKTDGRGLSAAFRTQTAVLLLLGGALARQMYHAAQVFARVRGTETVEWPDLLGALSLESLVLLFVLNALVGWSYVFAVLGFLLNLLYCFPDWQHVSGADPLRAAACVLVSAALPTAVAVCSHLVRGLDAQHRAREQARSNAEQELSNAQHRASTLEQELCSAEAELAAALESLATADSARQNEAQEADRLAAVLEQVAAKAEQAHTECEALREQNAQMRQKLAMLTQHQCPVCRATFPSQKALAGHSRSCKPANPTAR